MHGGDIRHGARSAHRCCLWSSTYCRMMDHGAPPQEAAKSLDDHNTSVKYRSAISGCCGLRRREETPLRLLTSVESATCGGYATSRCPWHTRHGLRLGAPHTPGRGGRIGHVASHARLPCRPSCGTWSHKPSGRVIRQHDVSLCENRWCLP